MANKAAVLIGTLISFSQVIRRAHVSSIAELKKFSIKDLPHPPKPGPTQVVIQMKATGICGSDVHYYAHGSCGIFKVNGPIVLGNSKQFIL
jgi:D-arabinose 1-dehydrogenase-like Zn-dependent alcohol dehydrogenase